MLKKGTPGKGGRGRADSFSYTPVATGVQRAFNAWLAGEPYWCLCHEHTEAEPGTKPCLDWLTDGALRCKRCRPHTVATWIGYVPLYRESDGKPILLIVHENAMDLLAGLKVHEFCLCGRIDDNSSVFVKRSEKRMAFLTNNEQRKKPREITGDLLTLWALPMLEEWLMDQRRGKTVPSLKSNGEPFSPMTAAAVEKYGGDGASTSAGASGVEDAQRAMLARVQSNGTNGNGKHKPR